LIIISLFRYFFTRQLANSPIRQLANSPAHQLIN